MDTTLLVAIGVSFVVGVFREGYIDRVFHGDSPVPAQLWEEVEELAEELKNQRPAQIASGVVQSSHNAYDRVLDSAYGVYHDIFAHIKRFFDFVSEPFTHHEAQSRHTVWFSRLYDGFHAALGYLPHLISTRANAIFTFLFIFRYLRLIVNTISFYLIYKPAPVLAEPTLHPHDCTIIIPTIEPDNAGFRECIATVLANSPAAILIVTVGSEKKHNVESVIAEFDKGATEIHVLQTEVANKRRQLAFAVPQIKTAITILVDDHVYWPSKRFLPTILAPFEDPKVGGVGTVKEVRRRHHLYWRKPWDIFSSSSIYNFLGCVYLERHNFEIAATNAIDGGVFVLSGRTSAHRTSILNDKDFLRGFTNEMFFFGKYGPIKPDDDNFITRWEVTKGWKLKIQYCDDARIETDLGEAHKWSGQCLRWVRTTWRSNSCSLFTDRTVWKSQPWCVYAVYITSFFNFALFYDAALVYTFAKTTFGNIDAHGWTPLIWLGVWIFFSKMIKLIPHFARCPADLFLIPVYLGFAYWHSLIKLYALFTFWNCDWGGRNLAAVDAAAAKGAAPDTVHGAR